MKCSMMLLITIITCVVFSFFELGIQAEVIVCNKPHEEYACGSACQYTCENRGKVCPIVNVRCNDECYCIKGYARNDKGVCIPECECPPKTKY